jgi:hypothetical protein
MKKALIVLSFFLASTAFAQTDRTVFGIQLGDTLSIPECAVDENMRKLGSVTYDASDLSIEGPKTTCFERDSQTPLAPDETVTDEPITIYFPAAGTPALLSSPGMISAEVVHGKIEEIKFNTHGVRDGGRILAALRQKYGAPSSLHVSKMQTVGGALVDGTQASWNFTNLRVEFRSAIDRIDEGSVVIETPIASKLKAASRKPGPRL